VNRILQEYCKKEEEKEEKEEEEEMTIYQEVSRSKISFHRLLYR